MPEIYLYEYAVIRVLPRVEREEFINIGVILFSKQADFLQTIYKLDEKKLSLFSTELDIEDLHQSMKAFDTICSGEKEGGEIARLDIPERFRWLTAPRSTSIQTSIPRTGFSSNIQETIEILFKELVL